MKDGQQRLPDSQQEQGLKSSQPAPVTVPINGAGTPIGPRDKSTENDNG
jgi:hypothetical protein